MSFTNLTVLSHGRTIRDEFLFPESEFISRIDKVNDLIKQKDLDGLIIYSTSLTRGYVSYVSGFSNFLAWSVSMLVLLKDSKPALIACIAPRDVEFTSKLLPDFVEVKAAGLSLVSNEHVSDHTIKYLTEKGILKGKKFGSVNFGTLPNLAHAPWKDVYPDGLVDCTDDYNTLRAIKSPKEIYVISQASSMAKRAVYEYMRQARPGTIESELAAKIDREQRINGANSVSMLTCAGDLKDTALHFPISRIFENGDTVSVYADIGLQGYHGCFGATKVINAMTNDQEQLFASASEILDEKLKEILSTKKIVVGQKNFNYDNFECYAIVNGVGGDLVEYPDQYGSIVELVQGMTITLSISVKKDGVGSVFMCENYLFTDKGFVAMSGPGK